MKATLKYPVRLTHEEWLKVIGILAVERTLFPDDEECGRLLESIYRQVDEEGGKCEFGLVRWWIMKRMVTKEDKKRFEDVVAGLVKGQAD